MKKTTVLLLILLLCSGILFAGPGTLYLRPMPGNAGIPMNPPRGVDNRYTPVTTTPGRVTSQTEVYVDETGGNLDYGKYTTKEMIGIGGISDIDSDYPMSTTLKITATCDNGFFMVSQSNPSYKRPFDLYLIPKARKTLGGKAYYGKEIVLGSSNYSVDLKFSDIIKDAPAWGTFSEIWFDMVLVLDGKMEKGDVLDYKGHKYPLTVSNDYSAVVNITVQHLHNGIVEKTSSLSIPFTGYYSTDPGDKLDDKVSMFIHSLPAASNIDMKNFDRQAVAQIRSQAVYEFVLADFKGEVPTHSYALFLSSHDDPFTKGEPFKLVKDDVEFPTRPNPNNSVGYDVILRDKNGKEQVYKGDEFVSSGLTDKNYSQHNFLISPKGVETGGLFGGGHRLQTTVTFDFEGTAEIQIHNNAGILMEAGRYKSSIYVHVIDLIKY